MLVLRLTHNGRPQAALASSMVPRDAGATMVKCLEMMRSFCQGCPTSPRRWLGLSGSEWRLDALPTFPDMLSCFQLIIPPEVRFTRMPSSRWTRTSPSKAGCRHCAERGRRHRSY